MQNRRSVIRNSLGLLALTTFGAGTTRADDAATADTAAGKIGGTRSGDLYIFKGVPYGASTAGANRFMPPLKPVAWTGVRDATAWAGRSPQAGGGKQRPELATVWGVRDSLPVGEDCLTLNVWTPALDNARRPVMVWLHGGAFSYGSANSGWYDGSSLARRNDVVVVSVNHRLNIFGHLDLSSAGDERFAQSGNVGVLDLLASLQWVRDHAARFGGDPGNVTIFGQSGGGGKVSALLAMPDAKGLFHKAVIESGASVRFAERERTSRLADAVLKQLELGSKPSRAQLDALQALPIARLLETIGPSQKALPETRYALLDRYNFGPVVDGKVLPAHPFDPAATTLSADIPVVIGNTKDEAAIFLAPDDAVWNRTLGEDALRKRTAAIAGDATDGLLAYYRQRAPGATPADLLITTQTASNFIVRSTLTAERKAALGKAPVWAYRFEWESPAYGGKLKSPHSMEIPFVFNTLGAVNEGHRKPGAQELADRVSTTWATFARTGNPADKSIPDWPAYTADKRATMMFNDDTKVANDPDGEVRPVWSKIATA